MASWLSSMGVRMAAATPHSMEYLGFAAKGEGKEGSISLMPHKR